MWYQLFLSLSLVSFPSFPYSLPPIPFPVFPTADLNAYFPLFTNEFTADCLAVCLFVGSLFLGRFINARKVRTQQTNATSLEPPHPPKNKKSKSQKENHNLNNH